MNVNRYSLGPFGFDKRDDGIWVRYADVEWLVRVGEAAMALNAMAYDCPRDVLDRADQRLTNAIAAALAAKGETPPAAREREEGEK